MTLMPRNLFLIAVLPVALYLALFHVATLDPTNVGWLIRGTDNGENALGLHAFLHDRASSWWPATGLLNYPEGVTLLFTDSNPLVALLAKPFAGVLPAHFQLIGIWVLICLSLQAFFATLLLRPYAPGFLPLFCGVALFLLLPTLSNRFIHTNLMAHWLILWSLWLFLDPIRAGSLRWWAAVMLITAMVHNYLLLLVAAVWASAMLERFSAGSTRRRVELMLGCVAILAGVVVIALAHGAGGSFESTNTYGGFAMSLDSLWNPANQSYSRFLPATEQRLGRGMEGFQYLGAGLLLLLPVAFVTRLASDSVGSDLRRLGWLMPALLVLTALAITPYVDFAGRPIARLPFPEALSPMLDMIRASGRLFWPVAYVILLVGIRLAYRLPDDRPALLLVATVSLQLLDISGMFNAIRTTSAEAGERIVYRLTPSPEWDNVIAQARDISFAPADAITDLALFQEVAWRAVAAGKPLTHVYAARTTTTTLNRLAHEDARFARGQLVAGRLYILLPGTPVPATARERFRRIDGVSVIAPSPH